MVFSHSLLDSESRLFEEKSKEKSHTRFVLLCKWNELYHLRQESAHALLSLSLPLARPFARSRAAKWHELSRIHPLRHPNVVFMCFSFQFCACRSHARAQDTLTHSLTISRFCRIYQKAEQSRRRRRRGEERNKKHCGSWHTGVKINILYILCHIMCVFLREYHFVGQRPTTVSSCCVQPNEKKMCRRHRREYYYFLSSWSSSK